MKTDKQLEQLIDPIVEVYQQVEMDLLMTIANKFDIYEKVGVSRSLEWWLKKYDQLSGLNAEAVDIIAKHSNIPKKQIVDMLKEAGFANVDKEIVDLAFEHKLAKVNFDTLMESPIFNEIINNSYIELKDTFKMINTSAVEAAKQSYMNVLDTAYAQVSAGIYDYNTAIKKALVNMVDSGIKTVNYIQENGTVRSYTLEGTIRRDLTTAVFQMANRGSDAVIDELKADYVEVSSHDNARTNDKSQIANHAGWQGRVYKLVGFDENYENFYTQCGEGDIQGFGGVNCKHRKFAFFPGISNPTFKHYDEEESNKKYELTQQQRSLERQIRGYKKRIVLAREIKDEQLFKKSNIKLRKKQKLLREHISENNLVRQPERERVYGFDVKRGS